MKFFAALSDVRSPIDPEDLPRNIRLAPQKEDGARDLFGLPHPAHGDVLFHRTQLLASKARVHRSMNDARRHAVDGDLRGRKLLRKRLGEGDDRAF